MNSDGMEDGFLGDHHPTSAAACTGDLPPEGDIAVLLDGLRHLRRKRDLLGKVYQTASGVDPGILYATECLDHVEALLFGIDGLAVLQFEDGLVRTDAHIEVAVGGGLLEKRDMPRMEHIITT